MGEGKRREDQQRGELFLGGGGGGSQEAGRKRQASGTFWKARAPLSPQWGQGPAVGAQVGEVRDALPPPRPPPRGTCGAASPPG